MFYTKVDQILCKDKVTDSFSLSLTLSLLPERYDTMLARVGAMTTAILGSAVFWAQRKNTEPEQANLDLTPSSKQSSSQYELKLVQVLFRHGARTPLKSIPDVLEVSFTVKRKREREREIFGLFYFIIG